MDLFRGYNWRYDQRWQARAFYERLRRGRRSFPVARPYQVALVGVKKRYEAAFAVIATHFVGVLIFTGSAEDQSVELGERLGAWLARCGARPAGSGHYLVRGASVEETVGDRFRVTAIFGPLSHHASRVEQLLNEWAGALTARLVGLAGCFALLALFGAASRAPSWGCS
jgi:hypothetical protein